MSTKLYVGNLPFSATEDDLRDAFGAHGDVTDVFVAFDKFTGRPRGFAFVTMATPEGAQAATEALNGADLGGFTASRSTSPVEICLRFSFSANILA